MQRLQGIAVSPGVTIGEALVMDNEGFRIPRRFVSRDAVEDELEPLTLFEHGLPERHQPLDHALHHRQTRHYRDVRERSHRAFLPWRSGQCERTDAGRHHRSGGEAGKGRGCSDQPPPAIWTSMALRVVS